MRCCMHYGKYIEDANEAGMVDQFLKDICINTVDAFNDSPTAIHHLFNIIVGVSSNTRDAIFFLNLYKFLKGLNLDAERQEFLREVLTDDKGTYTNTRRLLQCIERIETETKMDYIINATLSLLDKNIAISDYFRICQAITNTLDEDLVFLKDNILDGKKIRKELPYSLELQGLLTSGLMYQTLLRINGGQGYYFTNIAVLVDKYALSYSDTDKYEGVDTNIHRNEVGMQPVSGAREMSPEKEKMVKEKCGI